MRPSSVSPDWSDYGLQVRTIMASKCIAELARSLPESSHDRGLQVHISKLARSWPASVFPNMLDYRLQVHLYSRSFTALEYISEFTPSSFSGAPRIALKPHPQPVQIYRVLMGGYIDT